MEKVSQNKNGSFYELIESGKFVLLALPSELFVTLGVAVPGMPGKPSEAMTSERVSQLAKFEPRFTDHLRSQSGRRFSRYNFGKNLIMLAAHTTTKSNPDGWMNYSDLADKVANIIEVSHDTAQRHIRRAVDMGLLQRKREGKYCWLRLADRPKPETINFVEDDAKTSEVDLPN